MSCINCPQEADPISILNPPYLSFPQKGLNLHPNIHTIIFSEYTTHILLDFLALFYFIPICTRTEYEWFQNGHTIYKTSDTRTHRL